MDLEDQLISLVDDPDFQRIVASRSTFNLFEAVGAVRGELRHSNFLRFLFDPRQSHGLGSKPLEQVLRAVVSRMEPADRPVSSLQLILGDLEDAWVEREESNIDLLIRIKELSLVVLIENKIGAKAGPGQLQRYREHVEKEFAGWRQLLIFLTPDGIAPDDDTYVGLDYSRLAEIIDDLAKEAGASDAAIAMRHYVEMLRRHIVPDQQLNELALQLYHRHKAAIDFIIENIPNNGLFEVARQLVETTPDIVSDVHGATIVRFVPRRWDDTPALKRCPVEKWTHSGRHLLFEVKTFNSEGSRNRVLLALVCGPGPEEERVKLHQGAKLRGFAGLTKSMGRQYVTIFSRELLSERQGAKLDLLDKQAAIEAAWSAFVSDDLPEIEKQILEIVSQ